MTDTNTKKPELSLEQNEFIIKALEGKNILVDACIGSGKTTAIQQLCDAFPQEKRILYLTYNRLLKLDAQSKIRNIHTTVTNYHGFAMSVLRSVGILCGMPELICTFNRAKPQINTYDVLILDEYQDIDQELADMLKYIKSTNPQIQIIAVGDMMQKIYDRTTLDVPTFMNEFLGEHITLSFTKCFRLSAELAEKLGRIWKKEIIGVNADCVVEEMSPDAVTEFLAKQRPQDILCLGARTDLLSDTLNLLENRYPEQFNKKTVYASIRDEDGGALKPDKSVAIFTTFDSSKGLERPVCVVFDYTESYWQTRVNKPQNSYEILRNIFCVAASRGKEHIIFVNNGEAMLSERTLSGETLRPDDINNSKLEDMPISKMFQFKYMEDIESCYALLSVSPVCLSKDNRTIHVKRNDELIDLSPCIGIYQEAVFFGERSLDAQIKGYFLQHPKETFKLNTIADASLDEKILFLTALETKQERYRTQVSPPFVPDAEKEMLCARLGEVFNPNDSVQVPCEINFAKTENGLKAFSAIGLADVVKNDIVYELKFVSELTHEHFLQCAAYMIALNLEKGILWNTLNNTAFQITIPDRKTFLDSVVKAITKGTISTYHKPSPLSLSEEQPSNGVFAVIDTETNSHDQVMSVGIVLADERTFSPMVCRYYVFPKEAAVGGLFSNALNLAEKKVTKYCSRREAIREIIALLHQYGISRIFAYNASFDKKHLCELGNFVWCDIMWMSAYKQFNLSIPDYAEISKSGRLKRGAGVEPTMRRLRGDMSYCETHNAVLDALDELEIMRRLGHPVKQYVSPKSSPRTATRKTGRNVKSKTAVSTLFVPDADVLVASPNKEISKQNFKGKESEALRELSAELELFISKAPSCDSLPPIEATGPLSGYQEAHTSFVVGRKLLVRLRALLDISPTSYSAHIALRDFYEDEIMRALSKIPVEILYEKRVGIRVGVLKDSGLTNMQQIHKLGEQGLLMVYGIGPKNARKIFTETNCMVKEVRNKIAARSRIIKTPAGEKAVREYCQYKWKKKICAEIKNILASEEKLLDEYCSASSASSGVLHWFFTFSRRKKDFALRAAAMLQERITNKTQNLVSVAEKLHTRCEKISLEDAWIDYMNSPAEYNAWLIKNSN